MAQEDKKHKPKKNQSFYNKFQIGTFLLELGKVPIIFLSLWCWCGERKDCIANPLKNILLQTQG